MDRSRWYSLAGLVLWTFFLWGVRIRNVIGDDDISFAKKIGTLVLCALFIVLAVSTISALVRTIGSLRKDKFVALDSHEILFQRLLVLFTFVVWVIRIPTIALAGHSVGFTIVHTVLGVISLILAFLVGKGLVSARKQQH